MTVKLDLDVDAPDAVADILRKAAQAYLDSHAELASAWQHKQAGRVWIRIARVLDSAATRIEHIVKQELPR